jgi:phospholipid transport system substrate-binding protein
LYGRAQKERGQSAMRAARFSMLTWLALAVLPLLLHDSAANAATPPRVEEAAAKAFLNDLASNAALTLSAPDQTLAQREEALRTLLRGGFAIPFIARLALGKHWRRISQGDKAAYVALFGEFLLRIYGSKLATFDRERFTVVGADPRGKQDVVVETRILQSGGLPVKAGWRVRLIDGEPKIIDIVIEGVSMALNQRQEFASVLSRDGINGLMAILRARTQRLPVEAPNAKTQQS